AMAFKSELNSSAQDNRAGQLAPARSRQRLIGGVNLTKAVDGVTIPAGGPQGSDRARAMYWRNASLSANDFAGFRHLTNIAFREGGSSTRNPCMTTFKACEASPPKT